MAEVQSTASSIPESERKSVYYASGEDGLSTYASGASHGQLISLVGGKNVADTEIQGSGSELTVSIEQVMKWNPDVIIATDEDFYENVYSDSNMVDATKEFYSNFYHYDLSDDEAKDILTSSGLNESDL